MPVLRVFSQSTPWGLNCTTYAVQLSTAGTATMPKNDTSILRRS
jgi:hypothetical protein